VERAERMVGSIGGHLGRLSHSDQARPIATGMAMPGCPRGLVFDYLATAEGMVDIA
jgi:hypothetical protein